MCRVLLHYSKTIKRTKHWQQTSHVNCTLLLGKKLNSTDKCFTNCSNYIKKEVPQNYSLKMLFFLSSLGTIYIYLCLRCLYGQWYRQDLTLVEDNYIWFVWNVDKIKIYFFSFSSFLGFLCNFLSITCDFRENRHKKSGSAHLQVSEIS